MPSRQVIDDFLEQRHLAFVGVSRNPKEFANSVYRHLQCDDRTLYPVNAKADGDIEGDPCFATLGDVPDPVDGVIIMVPHDEVLAVVQEAVLRGIPRVWLHRGAGQGPVPADAVALAHEHGLSVVDGACPLMFAPPVHGIHRLHRGLVRHRIEA